VSEEPTPVGRLGRVLSSRALGGLTVVASAAAIVAGPARANGDPASDVLIGKNVFLPFGGAGISEQSAEGLTGIVREANKRGYRIKVAVIASKTDLGLVTALWHKPQTYARFLGGELLFAYKKGRLLIVMPNGFGLFRGTKSDKRVLAKIPLASGGDGLTRATTTAVERLARKAGLKLSPPKSSGGSSSGSTRLAIALGGVALVALLALLAYLYLPHVRRRRAG
jgi:hypothetical protein